MDKISVNNAWLKQLLGTLLVALVVACGPNIGLGEREIIFEILDVQLTDLNSQSGPLQIEVSANARSEGWSEAKLFATEYLTPPADGIYDFTFYATPPDVPSASVLTPIDVIHVLRSIPENFKGVRILSETNEIVVMHDIQPPPSVPAIISEITEVKLSLLKTLPPKLVIDVKGTVDSEGWSKATLVPHVYITAPQDGIYEFTFYATPPANPGKTIITPIDLTHVVEPMPSDLLGVRIFSETNNIKVMLVPERPSPEIISEITDVKLAVLESLPRQLEISVAGIVTGAGWTSPMLVPFQYLVPPQDGIFDFTFYATPPTEPGAAVLTPIQLKHRLNPLSDNIKGIRVHSETNEILALLKVPPPPVDLAIIDSITAVQLSKVPGTLNQLDINVKGVVLSAGWTQPVLIAHQYLVPPQDGVYDFTFYAAPPKEPSAAVLTPIELVHRLNQVGSNLTGIRVHANTNNVVAFLRDSGQLALNDNMKKWQASGITNYQYTYRRSCFCVPAEDIIVVVKSAVLTEAFYTPSGTALNQQELSGLYTIDGLFSLIQQAINNNTSTVTNVVYNANSGYPEQVSIDWAIGAVDDEVTYFVNGLQ